MIGLTQRQSDLLRFIIGYQQVHNGDSPTFRDMLEGMGLHSTSGIHRLMDRLQERGYVRRAHYRYGIEVLHPVPVPHLNGEPLHMVARFD